jgi:predicted nucleotidyltransferase
VQLDNSTRQLIVDTIRRELAGVSVIYLFGSYAKGEADETSDIDLAVLGNGQYGNV